MRKINIKTDSTLKYFQVFNGILELTDKELKILAEFVDVSTTINLCSAENKKLVSKKLNIKDPNTLNNYVKRLTQRRSNTNSSLSYKNRRWRSYQFIKWLNLLLKK